MHSLSPAMLRVSLVILTTMVPVHYYYTSHPPLSHHFPILLLSKQTAILRKWFYYQGQAMMELSFAHSLLSIHIFSKGLHEWDNQFASSITDCCQLNASIALFRGWANDSERGLWSLMLSPWHTWPHKISTITIILMQWCTFYQLLQKIRLYEPPANRLFTSPD